MKKIILSFLLWGAVLAYARAQSPPTLSSNSVRFMVSHEPTTGVFTAWVVPGYSTPNVYNPEQNDWGATAQFSLKVPEEFELTDVQDLKGTWDKVAFKLRAPASFTHTDGKWAYYIIGKVPQETNYGPFKSGEPVALFTFKGKGGDPTQVGVLPVEDAFSRFAEKELALNLRSSFYSRSGQRATVTAKPIEQMIGVMTPHKLLKDKLSQVGLAPDKAETPAENSLLVFPIPAFNSVNVTFFSAGEQPDVRLDMLDEKGVVVQNRQLAAKAGFNTVRLDITNLPGGVYFIRVLIRDGQMVEKMIKQ